jgi:hypothetical protein
MTIGLLEVGEGACWRATVGAAIGNTTRPGGRNDTSSSLSKIFHYLFLQPQSNHILQVLNFSNKEIKHSSKFLAKRANIAHFFYQREQTQCSFLVTKRANIVLISSIK